ncbi:MAG: nucleoside triphosphate pyrophosphohydrolase [Fimbriimonadaceae bacterium]|nr:nucleoside triphosphate pyrophosphohydrolase [Fimbriimonadaceae bacterium]
MLPEPLLRLGLTGSYQVHEAPVLLVPDARAHQLFLGFSAAAIQDRARGIFVAETPVWQDGVATTLAGLHDIDDEVVIPAQSVENPGGLAGVIWIVDRLLGPGGCPWDQAQTHQSLTRHLIEESHELIEAIESGDLHGLQEELGDVLLQPVLHAQMQDRDGAFNTDEVAKELVDKLVRRHPHVFGDSAAKTEAEVLSQWDRIKAAEKEGEVLASRLAGVPRSLPSLLRAYDVSKRAARAGFEWQDAEGVWAKLDEECRELRAAWASGDADATASEIGDLLFTVVNLARWANVEPESALRLMVDRFTARFQAMERVAGKPLEELTPQEWDDLWVAAKNSSSL